VQYLILWRICQVGPLRVNYVLEYLGHLNKTKTTKVNIEKSNLK
jgi:hypothetical protein